MTELRIGRLRTDRRFELYQRPSVHPLSSSKHMTYRERRSLRRKAQATCQVRCCATVAEPMAGHRKSAVSLFGLQGGDIRVEEKASFGADRSAAVMDTTANSTPLRADSSTLERLGQLQRLLRVDPD